MLDMDWSSWGIRVYSHWTFNNFPALQRFDRKNLSKPFGTELPSSTTPVGLCWEMELTVFWMVVDLLVLVIPVIGGSALRAFYTHHHWACILISLWSGEDVLYYVTIHVTSSHDYSLFLLTFLLLTVLLSYSCDADFHINILAAPEAPDHKSALSHLKIPSISLDKR